MLNAIKIALSIIAWLFLTAVAVLSTMFLFTRLAAGLGDLAMIIFSFGSGIIMLAGSCYLLRRYTWRRAWIAQLGAVVTLVVLATITGASQASRAEGFAGGVSWNSDVDQNMGYASVPGHESVDVWHRGHYPFGGFTSYRLHLKVAWSTNHHGFLQFDSRPTAVADVTNERGVDYNQKDLTDTAYLTTRVYGCKVHGLWRSHGCFFAKIKIRMVVKPPVPGVNDQVTFPWAAVWVDSGGAVVKWDYSPSII